MKDLNLMVNCGPKVSNSITVPLLRGKNTVGAEGDSFCKLSSKLFKPQHFQLVTNKSNNITLIPLVEGMQIQQKNGKMKELKVDQEYSIQIAEQFYIDKNISCFVEEKQSKKDSKNKLNGKVASNSTETDNEPKKKQKKQPETESEEEQKDEKKITKKLPQKKKENATKKEDKLEKANKVTKKIQVTSTTKIQKAKIVEDNPEEEEEEEQEEEIKGRSKRYLRVVLSNCELTSKEKETMEKLGALFSNDLSKNVDVVVMNEFKRRAKLLVGLNKGAAIVSKNWILDCIDDSELIQEFSDYYLEVPKQDQSNYGNLDLDSIQMANPSRKPTNLFQNQIFVLPEGENNNDLKAIIVSGNGTAFDSAEELPKKSKSQIIELLSKENFKKLKGGKTGIKYADPEFVLLSSLKQEIQDSLFWN